MSACHNFYILSLSLYITVCVDYNVDGKVYWGVQMHASDNYTAMPVSLITEQHNTLQLHEHVGSVI